MRLVRGAVLGMTFLICLEAWAQDRARFSTPETDLAVTYAALRGNAVAGESFWAQGGSAELMATFYHGLGVAACVEGTHAANVSSSRVNVDLVTATFGPTFSFTLPARKLPAGSFARTRIFSEALIGVVNAVDGVYPSSSGSSSTANAMALRLGSGADVALSRHLAVRLVQADWLRTTLPNTTSNVQNNLRLGAGVVIRFR